MSCLEALILVGAVALVACVIVIGGVLWLTDRFTWNGD